MSNYLEQWERANGYYLGLSQFDDDEYYVEFGRGEEIIWDGTFTTEEAAQDKFYELYEEYLEEPYWRDYDGE